MPDKCLDCPAPSADMDGFIVSGPGGAPRSEGSGVSSPEGPFVREAPQTGHFILKGKVSSSSPLPDVPEPGWAYEAAEAGTYGGVHATPGDLIWCAGVNPVRWRISQSDFDGAVRSVSVQQVLSSGTKIATVTVDGQATDLFCNPSGLASVSAAFDCGGQTWYLSSYEFLSFSEEDDDVGSLVLPQDLSGDLDVNVGGTFSYDSVYYLLRTFLLGNVPVYGATCSRLRDNTYTRYVVEAIGESAAGTAPEDIVLFEIQTRVSPYTMPVPGERIDLPVKAVSRLDVSQVGRSDPWSCSLQSRILNCTRVPLSVSPLLLTAVGTQSSQTFPYIGKLEAVKNPAFDWSLYEPGAKLALVSTSASGETSVQEVDMSCLNDRITSVSASMDCAAPSGRFSSYSPQSCRFYGYDRAGETPVEKDGMDYSLSGSTLSFDWFNDDSAHAVIELDGVQVDVDIFTASVGSVYDGSSAGRVVRLELVSLTPAANESTYVFSVYSALSSAVLSLTSVKATGASSTQTVDMSCLVPPVFDGSVDGLVPASGAAQNLLLHGDASWSTLVPDPASESSNEAAPIHCVVDMLRREVEAYTMGRNTIVRDQWNNPHVMLVVPRFLLSDIDASWPAVSHPAFIVGGQVRSEFLIGKYEAARSAAGRVLTLPGKAPWASVNFDAALAACRALGPGFCLQTRAMWSARQLWVHKLNGDGHAYLGNTNWGRSHARPWQTGVMQTAAFNPGDTGNTGSADTLTGSGGPFWNDDGTESGLADVTGNVSEWVAGLRVLDGEIQIVQDGDACLQSCDMSASSSAWKAVLPDGSLAVPGASGTMKFDGSVPDTRPNWSSAGAARLNTALVNQNVNGYYSNSFASLSAIEGVDVPALLVQLGLMPFSSGVQGTFWVCNKGERLPHAGGRWSLGSTAGPWALDLYNARSHSARTVGFRPAFVS